MEKLQPCGHPMDYGWLDHPECFPDEYKERQIEAFVEALHSTSIALQNTSIGLSGAMRVYRRMGETLAAMK